MTWIVPFASLVTAAIVPLAAGLYLLATTAWTLAERTVLRRRFLAAAARTRGGARARRGTAGRRGATSGPPQGPVIPGRPGRPVKPLGLGWGLASTMAGMQVTQHTVTPCMGAAARAISSPVAAA